MDEMIDPAKDGRRARGALSRDAILAAATALFSSHGYSGTGISAIAKRADVKSGSIYYAFGSKEGLLEAVMRSVAENLFTKIEELPSPADDPSAASTLDAAARILINDSVFLRLFLLLALENDSESTVRATVERVRARAREIVSAIIEPTLTSVQADRKSGFADFAGRIALIFLDGIFVSQQLDSEAADLDQTLSLMTEIVTLALSELPSLSAEE